MNPWLICFARSVKPVFLVVNKVDNSDRLLEAAEFYSLGFDNIFFISAMSGSGTGEVLDAITDLIPKTDEEESGFSSSEICNYRSAKCWQVFPFECSGWK